MHNEVQRRRVRARGVVQGVGFRPFIYALALRFGLAGWVLNDVDGVLIETQGKAADLDDFVAAITAEAPLLARITSVEWEPIATEAIGPAQFEIRSSDRTGQPHTIVPADSHVCADCLRETLNPDDRRYRYPFTNCTHCGPRYSLITGLPYDRDQTTMSVFTMCKDCQREYEDPADRRYHAQPIACPVCGPQLMLAATDEPLPAVADDALDRAIAALIAGQVVAVKSVGGFHLAVNARDGAAVAALRARKKRDSKPFAIMVADLEKAAQVATYDSAEAELLTSPARPIVLLRKRPGVLPEAVAPRNPNLGIMLPGAPLHHLLLLDPRLDVIVMTSGNVSGYPIAYRNEDALAQLFEVADLILYHDRDIKIRVDDSVLRCSTHPALDEPIVTFLRRSRGYAPYPLTLPHEPVSVVAYGAELKTTVAITSGQRVYVSQHIGDLKNDETFESHRRTAEHLAQLHHLQPQYAACDLHPNFRATRFALAAYADSAVLVQHHHAHMAACMADNGLDGPTIGVVFDGAGYGEDDTIWGGEFLVGDYRAAERAAHLRPIRLLGGDKAVHEPIRTAFVLALDAFGDAAAATAAFPVLSTLDAEQQRVFELMARRGINAPLTSSMGRLFDAIAALLGICTHAEYEAQGPIELEGLLERDMSLADPYPVHAGVAPEGPTILDPRPAVRAMAADLAGTGRDGIVAISRRFHSGIVAMVTQQCGRLRERHGINQVVLSGGVFLNEFIQVNCLVSLREAGFDAYVHRFVPTNDGGISLGQVLVADARLRN